MRHLLFFLILSVSGSVLAQNNEKMLKYREMALRYNQDLKAAQENISASMEISGMAKSDMKPHLGAKASYRYEGMSSGEHSRYSASVALSQSIYAGGKLLSALKKAEHESYYAKNESLLIRNSVSYQNDINYWNCVALKETVNVSKESVQAISQLVLLVRQRVDLGYADPNDLLMAEVKLNEATYQLQKSQAAFETAVMSLNCLIGIGLDEETDVEDEVDAITTDQWIDSLKQNRRPEQLMAIERIEIEKADKKIVNSKYLPNISIGAEGYFQSPYYDLTPQYKPNYGIYASLSVPIFEWGKRVKESRVAISKINVANLHLQKIDDQVNLEISSAKLSLKKTVGQVNLTHNSLDKAFENERLSLGRYGEGKISIMDVLQVQISRQNAQINYINAKLSAQYSWCELQLALNLY